MFSKSRIAIVAIVISFGLVLIGCGTGGGTRFALPPSGSFTNASLSGTYAFSVSGTNQFGFIAIAGSVQADGNGNLSSGILDVNNSGSVATSVPVNGTYNISADGRGLATLNTSIATFTIDFVMLSSNRALAVRFDTNSSASGSFDKQDSTAFSTSALTGQYAFSLSGIGANGGTYQSAGLFTADGTGELSNGLQDTNNDGVVTSAASLTGTYNISGTNGRGTMTLATSGGALNFAFYVVDATHLKLIETDAAPSLAGDTFRQSGVFSNASITGPFAFTLGGGLSGPFVAGGVFTSNGTGTITSGVEDINDSGSVIQNASTTGSYTVASTGRGTLTLNNSSGTFLFAVYPTTGGLLMLELDSGLPSSGTAFPQSGTPSASAITGNYGFNLTGVSNSGEIDSIAHVAADGSGNFTGAVDFNVAGGLSRGLAFNGPYTVGTNGRGTATFSSSNGTQNLVIYFVNSSRVLFVEVDSGLVGVGDFEAQQ